jgi:asparagine synthase (glutamine-hydrolysing)
MGFRRLSILDTSYNGHQPMVSPDGRYAITFNGEIYNFQELRSELVTRGHHFRSQTDTEVLLRLFELYGSEMLARLNGMFAFAIMDRDTETLFLARDRMGVKPLYYYQRDGRFLYASEVKSFLYHPAFEPVLDQERLSEYFIFRYVACTSSLLRGVRSVEPGAYVTVQQGECVGHTYWTTPEHSPTRRPQEVRAQFTELLQSSVKYQLISDVKIGCQLSGGVDSSVVSYWAARQHADLFDSISVIFQDPRYSEEPYIDQVNASLGLVGHKTTLDVAGMVESLPWATWHNDFPLGMPNCLGIYRLSQTARRHVTVLLSGEGADEVFGGYRRFYYAAWLARLHRIPGLVRLSRLERKLPRYGGLEETLVGLSAFADPAMISRVYPDFSLDQALAPRLENWRLARDATLVERLLTYEQRTYLVELLLRQDKMCMAHSVENRVPLLDHRIVELAKQMPTALKVSTPRLPRGALSDYYTKRVLKEMAASCFGEPFAYRPKAVFALPLRELFTSPAFAATFPEYRSALRDFGGCDLSEVDALYRAARETGGPHAELLWNVIALAAWCLMFRRQPALVA